MSSRFLLLFAIALVFSCKQSESQTIYLTIPESGTLRVSLQAFANNVPPSLLYSTSAIEFKHNNTLGQYYTDIPVLRAQRDLTSNARTDEGTGEITWRMGFVGLVAEECWIELHNLSRGGGTYACAQCTPSCVTCSTRFDGLLSASDSVVGYPTVSANLHVESDCGYINVEPEGLSISSAGPQKTRASAAALQNRQLYTYLQDFVIVVTTEGGQLKLVRQNGAPLLTYALIDLTNHVVPLPPVQNKWDAEQARRLRVTPSSTSESDEHHHHHRFYFGANLWWLWVIFGFILLSLFFYYVFWTVQQRQHEHTP